MTQARLFSNAGVLASFAFIGVCFLILGDEMHGAYSHPGWYYLPFPFIVLFGGTFIMVLAAVPPGKEKEEWTKTVPSK